ncbi:MAG: hypothetical protein LBR67_08765 [Dysgonamonadaceae bacterium]|jgi:hypothetical protein|nr:hypothetical protein [Dysgonamonadaceae bacterium]
MLHYFNPGHETAVLNDSPYYTLPVNPMKMQMDLGFLPAWYSAPDDCVLVKEPLDESFKSLVYGHFPSLPASVSEKEFLEGNRMTYNMEVSLWGNSPQSIHFFKKINERYDLHLKIPTYSGEYRRLCSRRTAQQCLQAIISEVPNISPDIIPSFFEDIKEIEMELQQNAPADFVIKSPYSSSGRGLLWIRAGILDRASRQILQGMLKRQYEVSLEKALHKETDFAMLFHADENGTITFQAYSLFQTNTKGNYRGNVLCSQSRIRSVLTELIDESLLENAKRSIIRFLSGRIASVYKGCICVDMMLYREKNQIRLHPCVEINFRYSMGWLANTLYRDYLNEDASGHFQIEFTKHPGMISKMHQEMQSNFPLIIEHNRIISGYLSLCPVTPFSSYLAAIWV